MTELSLPLHPPEEQGGKPAEAAPPGPEDESVLWRSVRLRFPTFDRSTPRMERVNALEDHICATAAMRGELAELRLRANAELKLAEDQWADLPVSTTGKQSIADAKKRARPKVWQTIRDAKWTVQRATEEVERMDADYASASRAYSIVTGS